MTEQEIIKELIKASSKSGVSALRLSRETDVSDQSIRNTFSGRNSPKLTTLIDICTSLGYEVIIQQKKTK